MRLDKYLKVARILKKRSVGKSLALNQRIMLNGRQAKPSSEIKVGDILIIRFGKRELELKIKEVVPYVKKEDASNLYEILDERMIEENGEEEKEEKGF